jgi:hypothetical protein
MPLLSEHAAPSGALAAPELPQALGWSDGLPTRLGDHAARAAAPVHRFGRKLGELDDRLRNAQLSEAAERVNNLSAVTSEIAASPGSAAELGVCHRRRATKPFALLNGGITIGVATRANGFITGGRMCRSSRTESESPNTISAWAGPQTGPLIDVGATDRQSPCTRPLELAACLHEAERG